MTPQSADCLGCGARYFPVRLRCRHCGGTDFGRGPVTEGVVLGVTRAHRIPDGGRFTYLAEVHCDGDLKVVAGAAHAPCEGDRVMLLQAPDGAIRIVAQVPPACS